MQETGSKNAKSAGVFASDRYKSGLFAANYKKPERMMKMNDTVKLLKECEAGCKTALDGMGQVMDHIGSESMRSELIACQERHRKIKNRCRTLLCQEGEPEADPPAVGTAFMRMGTGMKLAINDDDSHVAEMMADGANMGMKSIAKVMNACPSASTDSRTLASDLIGEERQFFDSMLRYL